jgi:hypothetical protein
MLLMKQQCVHGNMYTHGSKCPTWQYVRDGGLPLHWWGAEAFHGTQLLLLERPHEIQLAPSLP